MYTFQLDIGSLTTPTIGGGWLTVNPIFDTTALVKSRGDEDLQTRDNLSGTLQFRGDEYDALKTLSDAGELFCDIRVYYLSTIVIIGNLSLTGKYIIKNPGKLTGKLTDLGFIQDDLYGKILSHKDAEYSIFGFNYEVQQSFTSSLNIRGQGKLLGSIETPIDWTDEYYQDNGAATPTTYNAGTTYKAAGILSEIYYALDGDFETIFVSQSGSVYASIQDGNTGNSPATSPLYWEELDSVNDWTREYADFKFPRPLPAVDVSFWLESYDKWVSQSNTTDTYLLEQTGVSVFDCLESILTEIDPTIEIYETTSGANTGYCEYIENNFADSHYKFYWTDDDEPKLTLQEIFDIFENMHGCKWKFEGNIFVFRHPTERPATVGTGTAYDLTTYKSNDWTVWSQETSIIDNISRESWKFEKSNFADWDKVEIAYDNNFNDSKEHNTGFSTDIKHFLVKAEGKLIMAATYSGPHYVLVNKTGIISGVSEYNGALAVSYCVFNHHFEGRPFAKGTFNGNLETLTKKRNILINLVVPYFYPDMIDQENYLIKTNNGNLEVKEINISLNLGMAEIIAVK